MALEQTAQPKSMLRTIISVRHLRKVYRIGDEKVVALGDINLEILQGQIVCIVGTSGSGKSTFLNQLAGLEKPTRGAVYIGKTNISRLSENQLATFRQRYLGFVFQSYNLLPTMTALENVEFALSVAGIKPGKRRRQAVDWLEQMGIRERKNHMPAEMSGGEQARVAIGRALAHEPILLLADEPTSELDTKTSFRVIDMFRSLVDTNGLTIVMTTHDVNIMGAADLIYTMEDGVIIDVK